MIDKAMLIKNTKEYGRTKRVHFTVLTEAEKEIFIQGRFADIYKGNEYLELYVNTVWEVALSDSVLTFCVWDNETNKYLGYCNYNELDKEITAIGIELTVDAQNMGLGYEIGHFLIKNYFQMTDKCVLKYEATRSNIRSRKLAEKLGATFKEVNILSSLVGLNEALPENKRIDISEFDVFSYEIFRPEDID